MTFLLITAGRAQGRRRRQCGRLILGRVIRGAVDRCRKSGGKPLDRRVLLSPASGSHHGQVRSHLLGQHLPVFALKLVEKFLFCNMIGLAISRAMTIKPGATPTENIVAIRVLHQLEQRAVRAVPWRFEDLVSDGTLLLERAVHYARLHHVGGDFLFRIGHDHGHDDLDHPRSLLGLCLADDVLGDIIAELIRWEDMCAGTQLLEYEGSVGFVANAESLLNETTAVLVDGELTDSASEGVVDKIEMFPRNLLKHLVHDMISLAVQDKLRDFRLQLLREFDLLLNKHMLQGLNGAR